jgi:hypothetical protein
VPSNDPTAWTTFYETQAAASAALMGLVFVAITINLGHIIRSSRLMTRAGEALIQLGTVLAASTFALTPQGPDALGAELLAVGVVASLVSWRLRRHGRPTQEEKETLASRKADGLLPGPGGVSTTLAVRDLLSVSATLPFAIAGISVLAQAGGGLYWALAGVLGAYLAAMYGAWVLVIEIRR